MIDVTHLSSSGSIQEYAAKISDQIARQAAKQPGPESNEWEAGYAKGVKIARDIAQQRGYKIPDPTQGE
jgi:hypothetical protein